MDIALRHPHVVSYTRRQKLREYSRRYEAKRDIRLVRSIDRRFRAEIRSALNLWSALHPAISSKLDDYTDALLTVVKRAFYDSLRDTESQACVTCGNGDPGQQLSLVACSEWFVWGAPAQVLVGNNGVEQEQPHDLEVLAKVLPEFWRRHPMFDCLESANPPIFCLSIRPFWWCWLGLTSTPGHVVTTRDELVIVDYEPSRIFLAKMWMVVKKFKCESELLATTSLRPRRSGHTGTVKRVESGVLVDFIRVLGRSRVPSG
jgi:hypothetical protein